MKPLLSPAVLLVLVVSATLLASPPASSAAEGGRLMIKHSPVLGLNVGVTVRINGREAGAFTKGHIYQRYLAPGRHVIEVFRNGRLWDASAMTLDVRPGEDYFFVAKYRVNQLVLFPVGGFR